MNRKPLKLQMAALLLTACTAWPVQAQARADLTDGEVRKIDKDAAKVTLRHGEIKSLDMPPMTMVFHVKERAVLDRLKAGDKVRFAAVHEGGKYTVTEIQVVP